MLTVCIVSHSSGVEKVEEELSASYIYSAAMLTVFDVLKDYLLLHELCFLCCYHRTVNKAIYCYSEFLSVFS